MFTDGDEAGEDQSPLLEKHLERFSACQPEISAWGRYDWIEDLDTPELARCIKSLPEEAIELLTRMVVDGASRADLAREMGVSRAAITKRVNTIKKVLEKISTQG
jgi:DNA-directed RNA polymerase specialized sigma24 family protein